MTRFTQQQTNGVLVSLMVLGFGISSLTDVDFKQSGSPIQGGMYQRGFEGDFKQQFPLRDFSKHVWNAVQLGLLNQTHIDVVHTSDGWLFTAEEFSETASDDVFSQQVMIARNAGVPLVPVIIPDKARVHSDRLPHARSAALEARYDNVMAWLNDNGLPAIDLRMAMSGTTGSFLRTDTHWSAIGADVVTQTIAPYLPANVFGDTRYETVWNPPAPFTGDLTTFTDTGPFADWIGIQPETIAGATTTGDAGMSLFGDADIPVTLVGTSYSAKEIFNFAGFIKSTIGNDVLNVAQEGRGPFAPMADYLASADFKSSPPQLIIWEIPERYIATKEFNQ